jgi:regulator of protease activity HflC (stomatin/prohibitin superfamily)
MLHVKIPSADANRADFYNDDGSRLTIASFSDEERTAIMEDPLSHRSMIVVEVTILYEFVKSELYSMLTTIGDMEKLGERLGFSIKTALEGLFGRVTINTALEQKDVLSDIFYTRVRRITLESSNRPLGIRILQSFIGPIELDPDIVRANTAAAAAFARKKEIITLAQARKEELSLEGAGRAEAVGALEKYTKTEEGKKAADLDISRQIYQGVSKVIIAPPGIAGLSATLGQTLSSTL